jgi:hypothetical protein
MFSVKGQVFVEFNLTPLNLVERDAPASSQEISPQVGHLARPTEPSPSLATTQDTVEKPPEPQVPKIRIKMEHLTATVVEQRSEAGVQVEEQRAEVRFWLI